MSLRNVPLMFGMVGLVAIGCSRSDPAAYPTEFQVEVKGRPAVGATVVLHPVGKVDEKVPRPTGTVDGSGTVRISTFAQDDGAPPGDYTVSVQWREWIVGADQVKELSADKLRGKYADPTAASAPRVTVKKEGNRLPALKL